MIKTEYYKDLTKMNTFGMKVKARCFMEYDSVADLVDIDFEELARPLLHIGGGSNLLFTDDFKGTVLHSRINFIEILDDCSLTGRISAVPSASAKCSQNIEAAAAPVKVEGVDGMPPRGLSQRDWGVKGEIVEDDAPTGTKVFVSVGAGVIFDDFCDWAAKEGLWGVENLSYIPGEVGASAVQNIGAYGVEVKDVIHRVYCYDTQEEEFVSFPVEECGYGYRDSIFKNPEIKGRYIVTHVVFALSRTPQPRLDYGHLKDAVFAAMNKTAAQAGSDENNVEQPVIADQIGNLTPSLVSRVIIRIRKEKLPEPSVMGSAGSFFKNPVISAEHFARIEAAAKTEHGPDYKVPHYVLEEPATPTPSSVTHTAAEATANPSSVISSEGGARVEKSPSIKIPAAWLIEQCGWKGRRSGGAAVYEKQPLVIVNYTGEAYPEEIVGLEKRIIESVRKKFDITLHPEVEHI